MKQPTRYWGSEGEKRKRGKGNYIEGR